MYKPPFSITNQILSLCISITEKVSKINTFQSLKRMPILRKNNKWSGLMLIKNTLIPMRLKL